MKKSMIFLFIYFFIFLTKYGLYRQYYTKVALPYIVVDFAIAI